MGRFSQGHAVWGLGASGRPLSLLGPGSGLLAQGPPHLLPPQPPGATPQTLCPRRPGPYSESCVRSRALPLTFLLNLYSSYKDPPALTLLGCLPAS